MEKNVTFEVYKNLEKLLAYRKITPVGEFLSADEFAQKLNHYEYVRINGYREIDNDRVDIIIILIAPNSKYSNKTGDFKKLIKIIDTKKKAEVMFVSELPFTVHIKKQIAVFKLTTTIIYLEDHDYSKFIIEIPKHKSVPRHEIADEKEIEEFCESNYTQRQFFPKILSSDPMAVWIGLHPGQVAKIFRLSETAGKSDAYRFCIKG